MRPVLAYTPRRTGFHNAGALAASVYLFAFVVVAFAYSNPIVLAGAGAGLVVAGLLAGAHRALGASVRWGLALGVFIVAVNGITSQRGDTVLVHGLWLPLLGSTDISAEALAEGAILALRIVVVLMAFAVHSACVDPDRVLRLLRPLARRSALTATLIARLVPLAAADHVRLAEGAALRGPAAAPVGRGALARRLVAGSLDRAVDVAATLELRGYGHGPPRRASGGHRSRHDASFVVVGLAIALTAIAGRAFGLGGFDAYPVVSIDTGAPTVVLAALIPAAAALPYGPIGRRRRV
ncbi:MAG: energy-coupling factor transporter transmembrane protein EcfT [Actinomycetota bacterium]|nr:energy-coupling factor transporter transmembrane protein EcfT [Actinomycetota bacterium]